jgi:mono/diheme cytochrome c family protein
MSRATGDQKLDRNRQPIARLPILLRRPRAARLALAAFFLATLRVSAQVSRGPGSASAAPPAPSGQALYEQRCAICHYSGSTAKKICPGLKSLYARGKFADGRRVDDAGVTKWIVAGGADMPDYKDSLRPAEIRALVLYVKSL